MHELLTAGDFYPPLQTSAGITEIGLGAAVPFEIALLSASAFINLNWLWQIAQLPGETSS